ncbi:MAG: pseudaminic acid synthase [Pseudomonadota bacterium]
MKIADRQVGDGCPVFIVAEISANHSGSLETAKQTIRAAAKAGADAVKLQTYTADSITLSVRRAEFLIEGSPPWGGRYLHDLYKSAHTPYGWHAELFDVAHNCGLVCFSSPFDCDAVDFLETLNTPAYKIASPEINDVGLIQRVAKTGKPVIFSTGLADHADIDLALDVCRDAGNDQIAILKCTSAYPAEPGDSHLQLIPELSRRFSVIGGLSDHTLGVEAPVAAVALGARIIEKHIVLTGETESEDAHFSMKETEFAQMVSAIRRTEAMVSGLSELPDPKAFDAYRYRRSLFVAEDISKGELLTKDNILSVRPGYGLHPKYLQDVIGCTASRNLNKGEPLELEMICRVDAAQYSTE